MSASPASVPRSAGRWGAALSDRDRRLDAGAILIALLVLGLLLRVLVAGALVPLSGFGIDIGDFAAWAQRLRDVGPAGFYETGFFADYPPGYLYVLWLLGTIGGALQPALGVDITAGLVKLPGILSDVGVAALLYAFTSRYAGWLTGAAGDAPLGAGTARRLALVPAAIFLFNPGTIFNSAVWGQVDSVGTLVVLATLYQLARGRTEASAALSALALAVKFQYAFLIPIVAVVGIKRHLLGRSSDAERRRREPWRITTSLAAGLVTLTLLIVPFRMAVWLPGSTDPNSSLVGKFFEAAGTYTGLTINAINLWMNPWSGLGEAELHWGDDTAAAVLAPFGTELARLPFTWQHVGMALFAAVALLALWQVARRDDPRALLVGAALLAVAFFVLPTRVHERYLFPALALAAPLVLRARPWAACYAVLSASVFFNVYYIYTADWSFVRDRVLNPGVGGTPMPRDSLLDATLLSPTGVYLLAAMIVGALGWLAWRSWRLGLAPAAEPRAVVPGAEPAVAAGIGQPAAGVTAPLVEATPGERPASDPPPAPATRDEPAAAAEGRDLRMPAWVGRLRPAHAVRPGIPRRIDRVDLLLMAALVVAALVFRVWRLDVPRAMHFDEVYHGRSAAEWLGNWQHGWRRDVYEWTHPMLAKYLIAGGIVLADPNRVVGETALDRPAPVLAVAPKRSSIGHDRSVAFLSDGGTEIVARDAESGDELARWDVGAPVTALAYDDSGARLLVGLRSSGTVQTYALNDFMSATGGRAPPPASSPIETALTAIREVELVTGSTALAFASDDGIAVHDRATGRQLATTDRATADVALLADAAGGRLAATDPSSRSVWLVDATTLEPTDPTDEDGGIIPIDAEVLGPLVSRGEGDDRQLFVLTGSLPETAGHPATAGGMAVVDADTEQLVDLVPLPGTPRLGAWQSVANIVYIAGGDGGRPVLWAVEPHIDDRPEGSAGAVAFDETPLPGAAEAMAFDVSGNQPADDAGRLLVSTTGDDGGGALVEVDAGSNAFAWRLAGAIFGAILVALVYLLGATMFRDRRIPVLAGAFVAFDLMSYAMSRIAMNDIFVAVFIVAGYLLFWQVWSGRWRASAWWVLPMVGACIGLAAATKWVGFYALAGLLVLVIARSELGRLILLGGLTFAAVVAGLGAPWPFTVILAAAAVLMLVLVVTRPPRIAAEDLIGLLTSVVIASGIGLAFVLAFDTVGDRTPQGAVEMVFGLLARGAQAGWPLAIMLLASGALIVARAVRTLREPASEAEWFRPSALGGFGWAWIGACLIVVPIVVYGLSYVPYLALGHDFAGASRGAGYGWTLEEMHAQMFGYHFGLTAGHDAASPWWSWPLDLKPVWFYSDEFDGQQIALIYNGGNPILFWAGIPAMLGAAYLGWRRGSLALALLAVAFACQYLPWTRIERATFQYHYLTAVVFAMVAVAVFVGVGLRRAPWRDLAIGLLIAAVVTGLIIYPIASALPMPDWYANAMRAIPPWNFYFQFPDPPTGERGDLLAVDTGKAVVGATLAAAVMIGVLALRAWRESPARAGERLGAEP